MMLQKNVELELQALELVRKRQGMVSDLFNTKSLLLVLWFSNNLAQAINFDYEKLNLKIPGKKSKKDNKKKSKAMKTEDAILAEVMKQSELEYQQHQKQLQESENEAKGETKFDDAMEKVLSESTNHFEKYDFVNS